MFNIKTKLKNIIKKRFLKFYAIEQEFIKVNPIFDTRYIDKKIEKYAVSIVKLPLHNIPIKERNVAFLATQLYDAGGHTELLKNLAQALPREYKSKLFLTKKTTTKQCAMTKLAEIKKYSKIGGVDFYCGSFKSSEKLLLNELLRQILEFSPKMLITFIHPDDCFAVGLLALLKKHTQIKIIFNNMPMQFSSVGMSFAHVVWEARPVEAFVTQKYRKIENTKVLGFCYLTSDNLPTFSEQEIANAKLELGIPTNAFCTMSGGSSYKFFENGKSTYLEMIKGLLERNENVWHVLITSLSDEQKKILEGINIPARLIVVDLRANFKLYFKCADVFIGSYPTGGGMTTLDVMSLKIPIVVLENFDNLVLNISELLPNNYDYCFENISDMQTGIERLLNDKNERERIANANYEYFLENFEGNRVVRKILDADMDLFDSVIYNESYKKFKDVRLLPWGKP